jgi:hypothetical protein
MTPEEFFTFCQDRRNSGGEANKEVAILTVWSFLWGHHPSLPSKEEIAHFLDAQIGEQRSKQKLSLVAAYTWLKEALAEGVNA